MPTLELVPHLVEQGKVVWDLSTLVLMTPSRLFLVLRRFTKVAIFSKVAASCAGSICAVWAEERAS